MQLLSVLWLELPITLTFSMKSNGQVLSSQNFSLSWFATMCHRIKTIIITYLQYFLYLDLFFLSLLWSIIYKEHKTQIQHLSAPNGYHYISLDRSILSLIGEKLNVHNYRLYSLLSTKHEANTKIFYIFMTLTVKIIFQLILMFP